VNTVIMFPATSSCIHLTDRCYLGSLSCRRVASCICPADAKTSSSSTGVQL